MISLADYRVLVTGADGFIGSHLVERLLDEAASVRALCVYNSNGSSGWLGEIEKDRAAEVDIQLGDVRDPTVVRESIKGIDIVFHLAALIAIPYSYQSPGSYVETNVCGTLNVLEAVREAPGVRMIHTSTSEVYGSPETTPIREGHALKAQSPYAATKIAADQLSHSFAKSFGTPVVTLRPFNTYGPRQSARAVLPTIIEQLQAGFTEIQLGNLAPRRDLTYVTDTVDGFVCMAKADLDAGSIVQLGTGRSVSIGELFEICCQVVGVDAKPVVDQARVRPDGSEVDVLISDPRRAKKLLGWEAKHSLEVGITRTAEWMESRVDRWRASRYQR